MSDDRIMSCLTCGRRQEYSRFPKRNSAQTWLICSACLLEAVVQYVRNSKVKL
jgi:transcription elongation factor Elf1